MNLINSDSANLFYDNLYQLKYMDTDFYSKVSKYRLVLEKICREVTAKEQQVFSSLHARILFISEKYGITSDIRNNLHGLRKFANILIHTGNYSGNKTIDELKCIKSLAEIIYYFSDVRIPEEITEFYKDFKITGFEEKKFTARTVIPFIKAIVLDVSQEITSPSGKNFFTVTLQSEEESGQIFLNLYEPFLYLRLILKQHSSVNIFNLLQSKSGKELYNSTSDTLIVYEPDYLLEARAVADCFTLQGDNHLLYFVDKFVYQESSPAVLVGNIVNYLLDSFSVNKNSVFEEEFNKSLDSFQAIKYTTEELEELKNEIKKKHLKNLIEFGKYVKTRNILIEPTFISPEYGLQGRLDVMLDKGDNEKEIIELKSGSFPNYDTWLNNKMQVIAYNIILDSVYKNRTGISSIFYSKADKNMLRNVPKIKSLYCRLLNMRNKIVDAELKLASGNFEVLNELTLFNENKYPSFISNKFRDFKETIIQSSDTERQYFKYFTSFVINELKTAKTGSDDFYEGAYNGFASLWMDTFSDKEDNSVILDNLSYEKYNEETEEYIFIRVEQGKVTNFRDGDIGIVYRKNTDYPSPVKSQILKCIITKITPDRIFIKLRNKQIKESIFSENALWAIEHDIFEANYKNQTQSLYSFLKASQHKKNLLFCKVKPKTTKRKYNNPELNPNLNKIIEKSKSNDEYFILQGPPGTGKTSVALIMMIAEAIKDYPNSEITILAYTNRAVDEICSHLRKGIKFIKDENILCVLKNYLRIGNDNIEDENLFQNLSLNKLPEETRKIISNRKIIVSTVHSYLVKIKELENIKNPEILFVDEASQIIEPQLIGILAQCKKFVLIGDHLQLPAVVQQNEKFCKVQDISLKEIGVTSMSNSLFERLFIMCRNNNWTESYDILETHYRMHNDISDLVNYYYQGRLLPGKDNQKDKQLIFKESKKNKIENILSRSRVIFIPTKPLKENKHNTEEAKLVSKFLSQIKTSFGNKFENETAGVITPWRIQISKIRSFIKNEDILKKVTIDTVERFQGSEREIIIMSLAVYSRAQLGNLQSLNFDGTIDRKLNVALSRAKQHLIILGSENVLSFSPHYRRIIEIIKEKNGYIDNF